MDTPWTTEGNAEDWNYPSRENTTVSGGRPIFDESGEVVAFAVCFGWNEKDTERRAFIVKAVNSHERLVEALRGAIGALEFSRDYHKDLGNEEQAFAQDRLDAAFKALEGL